MTISQKIVISILFIQILIGETPYVVMVSFDGFRYDYSERVDTPNFDYIRDNGAKANSIQPVFPTKTFPNHYSLATGAYTQTHMLTGNSFYDKKFKEKYSISNRKVVQNPKWYMAEPIWVTAERQGVQTASYFWVGSEAPIKGVFPSIYKYYDGSVTYESRVDSVIAWLQLPEATRPHLVMLYFDEPDHTGHEFGPNSPELDKKIMYLDHILGLLINNLFSLPVADEINLIVVSDHGMTPTSDERIINLNTFIKTDNYIIDNSGPFAQITPRFFWQRFLFKNRFEKNPHLTVYPKKSIPHRYHFVNRNTRDFLLVAEDGWTITSGKTNNKYDSISLGNHGYDPQVKNMHGIFYAMGPAIKQGVTIETFENIH
ncbi:MAG: ectonucleotide pyrophosphatase/phosphodiesterase, partial [Fidelibacterota bacterium]